MRTAHIGRALSVATVVVVWGAAIAGAVKADGRAGRAGRGRPGRCRAGRIRRRTARCSIATACRATTRACARRSSRSTTSTPETSDRTPKPGRRCCARSGRARCRRWAARGPTPRQSASFMSALETSLERASNAAPNPGRPTVHRLNRTEYTNSVRDLLALDIDGRSLLPADDTDAHGFDNNADVLTVSPVLAARYLSAARKVSRLAIGRSTATTIETYPLPRQLVQDDRLDERLPFGSRGGTVDRALLPGRRRVRGQDPAADQQLQLHQRSRRPARSRGAPRSPARQGLHHRRQAGRRAARELGRHALRQHRVGEVRAADARRPRSAIARQGRTARSGHRVRPQVVGSRRRAPAAAGRLAAVERRDVRLEPGRGHGDRGGSACAGRTRRHAVTPADIHLPARAPPAREAADDACATDRSSPPSPIAPIAGR